MPQLLDNQKTREVIEELKKRYRSLPWYAKWAFPSTVRTALSLHQSGSDNETMQALDIYRALLNTWSIQRRVFSYFDYCLNEFSDFILIKVVDILNNAGLLNGDAAQASFNTLVGHQQSLSAAEAIITLHTAGLLTGDNRDAVLGHQYPIQLAELLIAPHTRGWITGDAAQANRDAVLGQRYPIHFSQVLGILNISGLLTGDAAQTNFNTVAGHQDIYQASRVLSLLNRAGLLTGNAAQANFNAVMITHSALLLHTETYRLWGRSPDHRLTPERFAALIEICQQPTENLAAGLALVIAYINHEILVGANEQDLRLNQALRLNNRQSTHTASIHQSVSESATRLMARYGSQISGSSLLRTINALFTWLTLQPDASLKISAAKRCLQRLTAQNYSFVDPGSDVSTKQLLALLWIAIHDETRRVGSLDDATSQLIEGLYEIQREYNLSETGVDNGGADGPACAGGTFNKIIEKGHGLHPDMVVNFISQAGFGLKFPYVVNEVAMAYLVSLDSSASGPLIEAIKADGNGNNVGPIWEAIQDAVATNLFDEFGSLFGNNRTLPAFVEAIATGEYVSLNPHNLSALDQLLPQVSPDGGAAAAAPHPDGFFTPNANTAVNESVVMTHTKQP